MVEEDEEREACRANKQAPTLDEGKAGSRTTKPMSDRS